MEREPLVFVGCADLAGIVRGKGFPLRELPGRLKKGVGLARSNIMLSAFGPIYTTPFGTEGDLALVPDLLTKVDVPLGDGAAERFYLGDIVTPDGANWECCPRDFLRRGLAALDAAAGAELLAAFEQEFVYTGVADQPGSTYALDAFRRQGAFGEIYIAALRAGGLTPDSFLAEYGPRQYEVTIAPSLGLKAADEAVVQRELARAVAQRLGHRAIFAPMLEPHGIGNGTHIHFSLRDKSGRPVMHDPDDAFGLTRLGRHFVAGVLQHMPALVAITAPSVASYYRLTPNRWAPTWTNLGRHDRGAAVRVCPIFKGAGEDAAHQFNVEYRVADAAASPHLALGALVHAGVDGIRRALDLPPPTADFWARTPQEREAAGVRPLPRTLDEALDHLATSSEARAWFGPQFHDVYLSFKRAEIAALAGLSANDICARYAEVY